MSAFAAPFPLRAPWSAPVRQAVPTRSTRVVGRCLPSASASDLPSIRNMHNLPDPEPLKGMDNPFPAITLEDALEKSQEIIRAEEEESRRLRSRRVPAFRKLQRKHRIGPAANRQSTEAKEARSARVKRSMFRDGVALRELAVGVQLQGIVQNLVRHGAYVDVGAVTDGLVHVRDMAIDFVHSPSDFVRTGDNVTAWVKYVNPVTNVLGLTMIKPKMGFEGRLKVSQLEIGKRYEGIVERVTNYGAYVDIGAERLGFLHVAAIWGRRPRETLDFLRLGQTIWVNVDDVDEIRSHIKLRARGRGEHQLTRDGPIGELAEPEDVADKDVPVVKSEILRQRVLARPGEEEMYAGFEDTDPVEAEEKEVGDEDDDLDGDVEEDVEDLDALDALNIEDMELTQPDFLSEGSIAEMFDGNTEFVGFNADEKES